MIRNMFAGPHFRPAAQTAQRGLGRRMGGLFEDILDEIGLDEVDSLIGELDGLIAEVPVGALKTSYQTRRDECLEKSLPSKYTCLYELFQDVKRALRDEEEGATRPPPTLPPAEPKEEDSWGWVPWAVGGVAAAGVIFAIIQATKG